jgi:restriction system protein
MRPILVVLADGAEHSAKDVRSEIAAGFALTGEELAETIPSKYATLYNNRIGWAITYLYRAKLVDRPKPATYKITERGITVLDGNRDYVGNAVLSQFSEFREFKKGKARSEGDGVGASDTGSDDELAKTPEERIEMAAVELHSALAGELIERIIERPPEFLERLVLELAQRISARQVTEVWTACFARTSWALTRSTFKRSDTPPIAGSGPRICRSSWERLRARTRLGGSS